MSDEAKKDGENFAAMFEAYEAGMQDNVRVGDKITGTVIAIDGASVFVGTGAKRDGVIEREELLDDKGELTVAVGDEIELYVVGTSGGELKLSKAMSGRGGFEMLEQAKANELPVEGKVLAQCKGGFNVQVMGKRAFCPMSQIDDRFVENAEEYVGQTLQFLIIKLEQGGRNLVVSRRELLGREKAAAMDKFQEEVKAGDVVEGTVKRLADFGAFIEVAPGVEGLAHISELSWGRVDNPADAVKVGDTLPVKLLDVSKGKKGGVKISLSVKQAQQDPWETAGDRFAAGDKVEGKVIRLADFGAFVEIAPGLEGLVHLSEMAHGRRIMKADEVVTPGQTVTVSIKDLDPVKRRISLSIKDAEGDPWGGVVEGLSVGAEVKGTVESFGKYGLFVTLFPGVTGLLPKSKLAQAPKERREELEKAKPGDEVSVFVDEIKPTERKITLGAGRSEESAEPRDWKKHTSAGRAPSQNGGHSGGMGLLGEKLAEAMARKKK
ncbi:RNA binding S1 domain protein [Desulfovibrio sp. X2]|uniref:30S ribosomal protein S1 n=1 Tax=Desulfovibrio sp. X2 TaxID=941449 RepID=UPI0003589307|nr:30S ribosomal protein S1 [Desulfovibrio sp. X2]EPR43714.1 RNA binding S1 domain protein [Desulfovibrio sp. X2]